MAAVAAVALLAALLVALAFVWQARRSPGPEPLPEVAAKLARAGPDPLIAPVDGRRILTETRDAWVIGSPGAWSLLAKEGVASTRVGWPAGSVILVTGASRGIGRS